jgi:hypothetical protein
MAKAKKTTTGPKVNFKMVGPKELKFDKINPRFAGMDVNPDDPTPYGATIDEMYGSMVEVYKSTGNLLLQPAGVDKDGNVRFGYTRLMTFVTRYDDLCKELGVKDLKIAVQYFESIDASEALTENIRRSDQHFMATAHTIAELRQLKHTYKSLVGKLGMSINRIKGLEMLADMNPKLQQLCYDGVINERAAVVIAESDPIVQNGVLNYIEKYSVEKMHGAEDAERVLLKALPTLHHKTPTQAFTSLDGKEYPMITEEEWIHAEGDLMQTMYVLDEHAEARRIADYYKMIAEQVKVWDKEKWKITCSESYKKVEMGTHPSEIAVWSGDNETGWLDFYVKRAELEKVKDPEKYVDERKSELEKRADNKEVNIKAKAKLDLMRGFMDDLATADVEGVDHLFHQVILLAYDKLNKAQREQLDVYMGAAVEISYNKHNLADFDSRELFVKMGMAIMYGEYSVYQAHRDFFAANGIDFNKEYNAYYEENLKEEIEKQRSRHRDLSIKAKDTVDDKQDFIQQMHDVIVLGTTQTLREHLSQEEPKEEKYIKYIAKGLDMTAKGGTEIVAFRLDNAVKLLETSFDLVKNDKREVLTELLERFNSIGKAFDMMYADAVCKAEDIKSTFSDMHRAYSEITGRLDVVDHKVNEIPVLRAAAASDEEETKGKVLVQEFIKAYAAEIKKDFGFRFVYLKNGKKVSILG